MAAHPPPVAPPPPSAWLGSGVWSDGELLVVAQGARLPTHLCVKCGAVAAESPRRKTLRWHEPWIALIALLSPLIYVIVALAVSKSIKLVFGLCTACRGRRLTRLSVGLGLLGGAVLCVALDLAVVRVGLVALAGAGLLLGGAIWLVVGRLVVPTYIDHRYAKIRGVSPAFRALFPPAVPRYPLPPAGVPLAPGQPDPYEQRLDEELRRLS